MISNKDRDGLLGWLGNVVEEVANAGADVAGAATELVAGEANAEAVENAICDSAKDVADVVALDLTDAPGEDKGPLPKVVRVALPGGTLMSQALRKSGSKN